jgi:protein arginine kinase
MIDLTLIPDGGVGWLDASGPSSHLVLSTRVRLARNLAGHPYASRNSDVERETVLSLVEAAAAETATLRRPVRFRLDRLDRTDRQLLHERHLVSKELAGLEGETGVRSAATLLLQDTVGAMVTVEENQRGQWITSGVVLAAA